MDLTPSFEPADPWKPLINIGATLDIPTGTYVFGKYGESILNGGQGMLTGVVGIANNFKSTIMHYLNLCAMSRIHCMFPTSLSTYDTEINVHETRLESLWRRFPIFASHDLFEEKCWVATDRIKYSGNKWWDNLKTWLESKRKAKNLMVETPFLDRDKKSLFKMIVPTFGELDSITEFQSDNVGKILDENEIGDSGGNMLHMRQGADKTRLMIEIPAECGGSGHYMSITAQIGKDIPIAAGPHAPPPTKKLQYLKNGDKLVGVSGKFFYAMSNCWHCTNAAPLTTGEGATRFPMYPREGETNNSEVGTDLNLVKVIQLRSKTGMTGIVLELIVSQVEGVLPELTEFHFIKENDRFGLAGNMQNYALDLLPDVSLSRTTIRKKIDSNPKLCRALNITAELLQLRQYHTNLGREFVCTAKELYDDLIKLGYDWETLLATRGWWTINNDKHPVPYLSTMDLLNMRAGTYVPYWFTKEQKAKLTVKAPESVPA